MRKGVYPYEYMDCWEKFFETSLLEKEDFYSHLNMKYFIDADYMHTNTVCRDFEIKNFEEYHDLYVQTNTLLLAGLFENFRKLCPKTKWIWSCKISFSSWISMASRLKKTKVKLDLLTDINMLLMVEMGVRGRICHYIYWYGKANEKANNQYMKHYNKIRIVISSILRCK